MEYRERGPGESGEEMALPRVAGPVLVPASGRRPGAVPPQGEPAFHASGTAGPVRESRAERLFRRDVERLARYFRIPLGARLPSELAPTRVRLLTESLARGTFDPGFRVLLQRIHQSPFLDGNRVQVFFGAPGSFDAMRRAIEHARREILVEFYVLADDAGARLAELLVAARARGVTVKVLADASHRRSAAPFWEPLRKSGVEVRLFQPFVKSPWYRPPRDHRKILVVDRSVAFTGGRDSRLGASAPGLPVPALGDVTVRVEGRTAMQLAVIFSEGWDRARGARIEFEPGAPAPDAHPDGASVLVVDSPPWRMSRRPGAVLMAIVESSRRSLWISNPCLAPKSFVVDALARAAERGVDVRLLVPEVGDAPLARSASRATWVELLRRGVSIHEFPGAGLQAKVMIADDNVSVVGSTNLDFRYLGLNAQCNLVLLERVTAATLGAAFRQDLSASRALTVEAARQRPVLRQLADEVARELHTAL